MIKYKKVMKCLKHNCKNKAIPDSMYCLECKTANDKKKAEEPIVSEIFKEYQEKSQKYDEIQETARQRRVHSAELRRLSRKLGDMIGGL